MRSQPSLRRLVRRFKGGDEDEHEKVQSSGAENDDPVRSRSGCLSANREAENARAMHRIRLWLSAHFESWHGTGMRSRLRTRASEAPTHEGMTVQDAMEQVQEALLKTKSRSSIFSSATGSEADTQGTTDMLSESTQELISSQGRASSVEFDSTSCTTSTHTHDSEILDIYQFKAEYEPDLRATYVAVSSAEMYTRCIAGMSLCICCARVGPLCEHLGTERALFWISGEFLQFLVNAALSIAFLNKRFKSGMHAYADRLVPLLMMMPTFAIHMEQLAEEHIRMSPTYTSEPHLSIQMQPTAHIGLPFGLSLFKRSCTDQDPIRSFDFSPEPGSGPGCGLLQISPWQLAGLVSLPLLSSAGCMCMIHWSWSFGLALVTASIIVCFGYAVGSSMSSLASNVGMVLVVGVVSGYLAIRGRRIAEWHVIIAKILKPISAVNETIIFSLIPPNVYLHTELYSRYIAMIEGSDLPASSTGDRAAKWHDRSKEGAERLVSEQLVSPGGHGVNGRRRGGAPSKLFVSPSSGLFKKERTRRAGGVGYSGSAHDLVHSMWKTPGSELVAADISATCIMFCCVGSDAEGQQLRVGAPVDEFRVLSGLFSRLDEVVEQSGFFKYQHIRMQYIVTCPRAAAPFSSNKGAYPHEFLVRMVTLGRAMMSVTEQYMAEQYQERFFLRVGIAHGSAAGAVVGLIRAFYCVYGDTINTAARLCMLAKQNHMHCSEAFVGMLAASTGAKGSVQSLGLDDLDMTPRGRILVKGKGTLSTFDVRGWVTQPAEVAAAAIRSIGPIDECEHKGISRSMGAIDEKRLSQETGLAKASRDDTAGSGEGALCATLHATASTAAEAEGGEERGSEGGKVTEDMSSEVLEEDLKIDDLDLLSWKDLSQTGLRYLKSGKFNITTVSVLSLPLYSKFDCRSTERLYHLSSASDSRLEYFMFTILHCAAVCCQYHNIVFTQHRYDFRALGAPELQDRQKLGHLLLTAHLAAAAFLALVLCGTIFWRKVHSAVTAVCVLALQFGWMACCVYVSCRRLNNHDGWLLAWTFSCLPCEVLLLPGRNAFRLQWMLTTIFGATAMCFVFLVLKPHYKTEGVGKIFAVFLAISFYVRYAVLRQEYYRRRNWRLIRLLLIENRAMRLLVRNLLPFDIATAFYRSAKGFAGSASVCAATSVSGDVAGAVAGSDSWWSKANSVSGSAPRASHGGEAARTDVIWNSASGGPCLPGEGVLNRQKDLFEGEEGVQGQMGSSALTMLLNICALRRVIVVQLDICKWTHLASTVEPLALAELVHALFCDFDFALSNTLLFKVDNMGDAYLCCGWLPEKDTVEEEVAMTTRGQRKGGTADSDREMVYDALYLARSFLTSVKFQSRNHSLDLHVRMGIATGMCVAGVMGRLQARFQILGPAIETANALEQKALADHIHVDALTMSMMQRAHGPSSRGPQSPRSQLYEGEPGMGMWELKDNSDVLTRETSGSHCFDEDSIPGIDETAPGCYMLKPDM